MRINENFCLFHYEQTELIELNRIESSRTLIGIDSKITTLLRSFVCLMVEIVSFRILFLVLFCEFVMKNAFNVFIVSE